MAELIFNDSPERMLVEKAKISYRKVGRTLAGVVAGSNSRPRTYSQPNANWGRAHRPTWSASLSCLGIIILSPLLVIFSWITLSQYQGSLLKSSIAMYADGPWQFVARHGPTPSLHAFGVYTAWVLTQCALYNYIPTRLSTGQLTPAGHLLQYRTNGLSAWVLTHIAIASGVFFQVIDPAWIAKNWSGLIVAANSYGFLLSAFVYIKAYIAPTHEKDRKFSGSIIYDFYMGIEFNPRFGEFWDFKLFHNGRPGIVAWTLIDLSFAAWQYENLGYITNSMVVATILHATYVVDFYINEDWYLRTIDICHDHFGFYLGWGSVVWLPTMYTVQAQYLVYNPVSLPPLVAAGILATGLSGYVIFRSVNHQKDIVRRTDGKCLIWGQPAGVLKCTYSTADGKQHQSLLLYTGWWGLSRHANYLGDLILSYSMCATCGVDNLLPWFYAIFMTILLLHRCKRAEQSCAVKYGKDWDTYCQKVRWTLIPGIY
ncbi:7-dehydrocholesterol reductase [Lachnellula arida]|uniref:7-dehydrocholesterol reductase n=1 Tax=Lachnellula arida TaxID=1316785 RepID=A0A8T9BJV8_9HELO|nr:7-dehydrocholesterol reductase [Lachnellula arida]